MYTTRISKDRDLNMLFKKTTRRTPPHQNRLKQIIDNETVGGES